MPAADSQGRIPGFRRLSIRTEMNWSPYERHEEASVMRSSFAGRRSWITSRPLSRQRACLQSTVPGTDPATIERASGRSTSVARLEGPCGL